MLTIHLLCAFCRSILKPMLAEAGCLQHLQHLQLSNLGLDELPPGICSLNLCQELQLQNNELPSVPEEIGAMSSLRSLDLSNNKLTTLPASMVSNRTRKGDLSRAL